MTGPTGLGGNLGLVCRCCEALVVSPASARVGLRHMRSRRLAFGGVCLLAVWQHRLHNNFMPTSITIRDVPDETRDELAARAALTGRSLQEYLRSKLVELTRQPDAETLVERIRSRKAATASALPPDRILSHRDEDRR